MFTQRRWPPSNQSLSPKTRAVGHVTRVKSKTFRIWIAVFEEGVPRAGERGRGSENMFYL